MRVCDTNDRIGYPIKLEQRSNRKFRVTYGKQVKDNLTYSAAATELGSCLMHAMACEGLLDNGGSDDE